MEKPCRGGSELETSLIEEIDGVYFRIPGLLKQDCRLIFRKIATRLGISATTSSNHIRKMEKEGMIKGWKEILYSVGLGYNLAALLMVQAQDRYLNEVENRIAGNDSGFAIYDIARDYDAVTATKFKGINSLNEFIENLIGNPHVRRVVSRFFLNIIKESLRLKFNL